MNTTQHDTTLNTTRHYYMGTYLLGSHLWNAGESYMDKAESMVKAGAKGFARQFLAQAEEAYSWANALQAGIVKESLDDLLGVQIDTLDAWVVPERVVNLRGAIAMLELVDTGGDLPLSPSDVSRETYSPQNVSRETFVTPLPSVATASAYDEVMETYTPQQQPTKMNDVLVLLVNMITDLAVSRVQEKMEDIAEAVYDAKDITEDVVESYHFANALENAISEYDMDDKVREALNNITFTVSVD